MMRLALLAQERPDGGAQSVGADQGGTGDPAAIGGRDDDPVAAILESRHGRIRHECDVRLRPAGVHQHVMEIDPVNDQIRVPEPRPERGSERNARNLLARIGIDHQAGIRKITLRQHRRGHAQPVEHGNYVGAELDPVADGAEFRRLFKNAHSAGRRGREQARR